MELDMNESTWKTACPKVDCRNKKDCRCGLKHINIPASLGDDSDGSPVEPKNGDYCNAIVIYEANNHVYIYSAEGIPTLIDVDATDISELETLTREALERIADIEDGVVNCFDTVADMKASDTIKNGSYARTLGYYSKNDGGGATYFIVGASSSSAYQEQLNNGLYASYLGKEIKTSQVGMVPNDSSEADDNFAKLSAVVDFGYPVIVDDVYYINASQTYTLTTNLLSLKGETNTDGFIFNPSFRMHLFVADSCEDIYIENLTLENIEPTSTYNTTLIDATSENHWHINNFVVKDNTVKGTVCMIYAGYDKNISPVIGTHGFDYIKIIDNKFFNLTRVSCFNLFDTIAKKIEIKNNYIHNFTNKFFGLTVTNGGEYEYSIPKNVVLTEIDNNYVFCDDDYMESSSSNAGYYTFVLLEGNTCIYTNNHVEGLKAFSDIALYDAYLSVSVLYSSNNVYKNNLLFLPGENNCVLLKSKGGDYTGDGVKRYYDHNTYIIEEDWQKRFDPDLDIHVLFISLQAKAAEYQVTNCYFDVASLWGARTDAPMQYGNLVFKDNYMKIKNAGMRPLISAMTENDDDVICIQNNTVIDQSYNSSVFGGFVVTKDGVTSKNIDKVYIEYNRFSGRSIIDGLDVNMIKICDNEFELTRTTAPANIVYSSASSPEFIFKGNSIETVDPQTEVHLLRWPTGANIVDIDNTIYARYPADQYQGFKLSNDIDTDDVYRYFFEFEIQHTAGVQRMNFYVDYGKDVAGNYVKIINTNNEEVTLHITDANTSIKINNETSVTTSTASIFIKNNVFSVLPSVGYSVSGEKCFMRMKVKSVKL